MLISNIRFRLTASAEECRGTLSPEAGKFPNERNCKRHQLADLTTS
jgi:hypothetical protein